MTMQIADFQDAFVASLYHRGGHALARQPGFQVYRNSVIKGCVDALQANFPSVERLVGSEWFRAAAAVYAHRCPPVDRSLLRYGHSFERFLEEFEPAGDLPYLPGVARLDFAWLHAHIAADAATLASGRLASLTIEQFAALRLVPHPATQWFWFADAPVYSIWDAARRNVAMPETLQWQPEGVMLVRRDDEVQWMALDRAGIGLLDAFRAGASIDEAMAAAGPADAALATLLPSLIQAGAFSDLNIASENPHADPRS